LENTVESVVSDDLEGLQTASGFQQLLDRIEGWAPGSGSMAPDQTSDHGAGWQSHIVQTLASFGDGKGGPSQGGQKSTMARCSGWPAACIAAIGNGAIG
jgi:hypothetical protein